MKRLIRNSSYIRSSRINYDSHNIKRAMDTQARDFYNVDVTSMNSGDIVEVNGLEWRLCHTEQYPRAIEYKFINDDTNRTITIIKTPGHPEWLRMSSTDSSLNAKVAIDTILNSNKPCVHTHGLSYRNPTTYRVPISKDDAVALINKGNLVDVEEEADVFVINTFGNNDLW